MRTRHKKKPPEGGFLSSNPAAQAAEARFEAD
jgi:hypothetical protein